METSFESVQLQGRNLDLSNARENPEYHSATGGSYIDSSAAASLSVKLVEDIDYLAQLLSVVSYKDEVLQQFDQCIHVTNRVIASLKGLDESSEIQHTQPHVIKILSTVSRQLYGADSSYIWNQNQFMPRNTGLKVDGNAFMCRIFVPRDCKPDIMLSQSALARAVGPVVEIKLDHLLQDCNNSRFEKYVRQGALYGLSFIQRVFPMMPSNAVSKIFGPDWYVYVPLLSHQSLYMLRIDLSGVYISGDIRVCYSSQQSGIDMAKMLSAWVMWACRVSDFLNEHVDFLMSPCARFCWIPPQSLLKLFPSLNVDHLVARPSFYNPIYVDIVNKAVYKLISVWSANLKGIDNKLLSDPLLCEGWMVERRVLRMPLYESFDLHRCPPQGLNQLIDVLKQLVLILMHLNQVHQMCHCDIRAANVCWKTSKDIVLIDYDLATVIGEFSPKPQKARDSAPDIYVHENHDLWLVGVMILQLTLSNFSWDLVTNRRNKLMLGKRQLDLQLGGRVRWKDAFAAQYAVLTKMAENCLQLHQYRWSLTDLKGFLDKI
ncbi:hypothetical protein MIR68_009268 [Amoeboaphelidium protococcarum]|nr:hypothetical protein MIR68_009268 [Amoeboaphelidium protococcarum]